MQQSNAYIIGFTAVLTIVLASLLSGVNQGLKDKQKQQVDLDTKKNILGAVIPAEELPELPEDVLSLYAERISSLVVDIDGNEVAEGPKGPLVAEEVNIQKNYKVDPASRQYPVFVYKNEKGEVEAYIFPMFGAGLWDWIAGYIALEKDLNTVAGIAFSHKQETPGLGARITEIGVRDRYKKKKIFDGAEFRSVTMVKGEGNTGLGDYEVDGMSGATMTAKGVNQMLSHYLKCYSAYIMKLKSGSKLAINE